MSDKTNWRQPTLAVILKTVPVRKNKKRLRSCHTPEAIKEAGWLNVMWYSGCDSGTEKGH